MVTSAPIAAGSDASAPQHPPLEALPIAPEFPRALAAGVVWASISVSSSAMPLTALVPLCLGAVWTQLLLLLAAGAVQQSTLLRARLALGAAVLGLGTLFIGQVLQAQTHHRPLGAVVWVLLVAALCVPVAATVQRVKPSAWLGLSALALALLVLLWHGRDAIGASVWIQALAGLLCCCAALVHRRRWPRAGSAMALPIAAILLLGTCWVLWSGQGSSVFEQAPLVVGALGLL